MCLITKRTCLIILGCGKLRKKRKKGNSDIEFYTFNRIKTSNEEERLGIYDFTLSNNTTKNEVKTNINLRLDTRKENLSRQ